jgi:hypothetical protein
MDDSLWPTHGDTFDITNGQRITITTRADVEASAEVLPITFSKFTQMCEPGDIIYIGRCAGVPLPRCRRLKAGGAAQRSAGRSRLGVPEQGAVQCCTCRAREGLQPLQLHAQHVQLCFVVAL